MVDIDANEIYKDRGIKIDLPIVKDAQEFLEGMLSFTERLELNKEWLGHVTQWKNLKEKRETQDNILTSYEFPKLEYNFC